MLHFLCEIYFYTTGKLLNGSYTLHEQVNHPPHIKGKNEKLSSSAFIPFCELGGNMKTLGVNIKNFNSPVCNSFNTKILYDQLCYEIDLNQFELDSETLKSGVTFLIDNNEDRQYYWKTKTAKEQSKNDGNFELKFDFTDP